MTTAQAGLDPAIVPIAEVRSRRNRFRPEGASKGETGVALAFIAPAFIGFCAFFLYPTIRGLYLSFTDYDIFDAPNFTGFTNYIRIANDPLFWNAIVVTLEYVMLNIIIQTTVAVGLAVLMQRLTKSIVVRGSLLIPYLISNVIAAMIWFWLLDYNIGLINQVVAFFGIDKIAFFNDPFWAIPTIALVNVWRHMGYTALLVFAGLQTIPNYVYEAASIDGSSEWKSFWRITLPLLRPIIALVLVVTVVGSFQIFDTVAVTTKGGPINASRVLQYYIYSRGFGDYEFGYASALSVVLFVILAIVALVQLRLLKADESDLA